MVQTRSVLWLPFTMVRTRRRLGFQRRLVTLCAWLIRLPNRGVLPQISHIRAIPILRHNTELIIYHQCYLIKKQALLADFFW